MIKRGAELGPGDRVVIAADDERTVESISFTDKPVDSHGTTGVRISWRGWSRTSVVAADKEMTVL